MKNSAMREKRSEVSLADSRQSGTAKKELVENKWTFVESLRRQVFGGCEKGILRCVELTERLESKRQGIQLLTKCSSKNTITSKGHGARPIRLAEKCESKVMGHKTKAGNVRSGFR